MSGRMPVASRQLLIVHRDPTTNKKINSVHIKLGLCAASTLINFFLIDLIERDVRSLIFAVQFGGGSSWCEIFLFAICTYKSAHPAFSAEASCR